MDTVGGFPPFLWPRTGKEKVVRVVDVTYRAHHLCTLSLIPPWPGGRKERFNCQQKYTQHLDKEKACLLVK